MNFVTVLALMWSSVKNMPAKAGNKRSGFDPWVREISGGEHGNLCQYSCPRILWTEELMGYSPWGRTESDTRK